ncbi:MAG: TolC family protein [Robiginitalea sp.]|nr:TolC family protein [Robiginitalea sp.]
MKSTGLICFLFLFGAAHGQDLPSYIQEAQENNPDIQAFELRYQLAEERVQEADRIPETQITAGVFVSEPETRTGAQKARFSVKQMLPWFGTLSLRSDYASSLAEAEYIEYVIARRKLALQVAQGYYNLVSLEAKKEVLDQNIALLKTYEKLALTAVEVNQASAVDVLRLQIRQNELRQRREILKEEHQAERSAFNGLLNREPERDVPVISGVTVPESDLVAGDSLQLNPELLRFDKLYESVARAEMLNQKEGAPSFGIGLDYIPVAERPGLDFSDNGKDILMPMVSLNIPIFNNRFDSRSKQNELRQRELESLKQERINVLETALARAKAGRNAARIRYQTQESNLKQARDATQILLRNYETGTIDFNDVLEIQELQLKFQEDQIEAIRAYFEQTALIQYITE